MYICFFGIVVKQRLMLYYPVNQTKGRRQTRYLFVAPFLLWIPLGFLNVSPGTWSGHRNRKKAQLRLDFSKKYKLYVIGARYTVLYRPLLLDFYFKAWAELIHERITNLPSTLLLSILPSCHEGKPRLLLGSCFWLLLLFNTRTDTQTMNVFDN